MQHCIAHGIEAWLQTLYQGLTLRKTKITNWIPLLKYLHNARSWRKVIEEIRLDNFVSIVNIVNLKVFQANTSFLFNTKTYQRCSFSKFQTKWNFGTIAVPTYDKLKKFLILGVFLPDDDSWMGSSFYVSLALAAHLVFSLSFVEKLSYAYISVPMLYL